jgi:ABC-2 type transport system permease protein
MSLARRNVSAVARRELAFFFSSPIAYSIIGIFLVGCGIWLLVPHGSGASAVDFFEDNRATLRPLFEIIPLFFAVLLPAVTMRLLSEEKKSGTIELLITMPITDGQIVLGKFLGALGFLTLMLLSTLLFPLLVSGLGDLDGGLVLAGYVGLFLVGAAYIAIGLMTSTWTQNQILAFVAAVALSLLFWGANSILELVWEGARDAFAFMSVSSHFDNIARGVIDTRDVVFYLSFCAVPLVLAVQSLQARNWK